MNPTIFPHFIRLGDLAQAAGLNVGVIERCIYRNVLVPDATIEHGKNRLPIFLHNRLETHLENIRRYRKGTWVAPRDIDAPWI